MKAITRSVYGPPEVLQIQELEKPIPADGELLVRVYAATVNRTDCANLWGKPYAVRAFTGLAKPRSPIPGTDFAGEVVAVGRNVSRYKAGDRLWGFNDGGLASYAQYMTISEKQPVGIIPEGISYEQAAASIEGAHYAYNFINKVKLQAGQKVLVNGATGAIGSAAVQLLKPYGVKITAVANTPNLDLVRSLGADRVIDYTREDFTKDDERYHFVFDTVGKSTFGKCKPILLPEGVYISSELGPNWENLLLSVSTPLMGKKKVVFPFPSNVSQSIRVVGKLLEEGRFNPVIDRRYPMEQVADAFRYVASGQKVGNVILLLA